MKKSLFCFGYGYTCDYLRHELLMRYGTEEWDVVGTTRDPLKMESMEARGITTFLFDTSTPLPDPSSTLKPVTHLIVSTPPGDNGDPAFYIHEDIITHMPNLEWIGYLSTTGVYGNREGEWVDENSELRPNNKRGSRRQHAEEQWLSLYKSHNLPVHIFRLAGIYGPGRSALDSVRAGMARRINKPDHVFNRSHVEDIANILSTSMHNPKPGAIYNISDDEPAPSHEIISYACELLRRPAPPMVNFEEANLAPITRSFYSDNKRVKNDKIKEDLGITLKYPNYRAGLMGCFEAEQFALAQLDEAAKKPAIFS